MSQGSSNEGRIKHLQQRRPHVPQDYRQTRYGVGRESQKTGGLLAAGRMRSGTSGRPADRPPTRLYFTEVMALRFWRHASSFDPAATGRSLP